MEPREELGSGRRVLDPRSVAPAQRADGRDERDARRPGPLPTVGGTSRRSLREAGRLRAVSCGEVLARHDRGLAAPHCGTYAPSSSVLAVVSDGSLGVALSDGRTSDADAVVLATGVETPLRPAYLAALAGDERIIEDPWAAGVLEGIGDGETVAIVGTSLTAIDLAGSILNRHPRRDRARAIAPRRPAASPRGPVAASPAGASLHRRRIPGVRRSAGRCGRAPAGVRAGLAACRRLAAPDLPGAVDGDGRPPAPLVPRRLPP